jgi:hypothetical protein
MAAKFEIFKDKIGEFRWRLTHTNGHVIATSGRSRRMYPALLLKIGRSECLDIYINSNIDVFSIPVFK